MFQPPVLHPILVVRQYALLFSTSLAYIFPTCAFADVAQLNLCTTRFVDDGKNLPPPETSTPPPLPDDLVPKKIKHGHNLPPGENGMNVYTFHHGYIPIEQDGMRGRSFRSWLMVCDHRVPFQCLDEDMRIVVVPPFLPSAARS